MRIPFSKYSGCGNDFIIIDNRSSFFSKDPNYIQQLCLRPAGIGADGLILIENSETAPYKMSIFNADGSEAEMCGNGLRCAGQFIKEADAISSFIVETRAGALTVEAGKKKSKVGLPFLQDACWNFSLASYPAMHLINTGVPHAVLFVPNLAEIDVCSEGSRLRHHPYFQPQGTNVDYASIEPGCVRLRTYERGVEGETNACGTGAAAAALAAAYQFQIPSPVVVIPRSGEQILVYFQKSENRFTEIAIQGSAQKIFDGFL